MTSIPYTSISTNGRGSLTVVLGDELTTITDDNPVFDDVLAELQGPSPNPDTVRDLLAQSTTGAVASRLEELTDRVSYDGTDVLFDGEPVHGTVVEHIRASLVARTRDWAPLAAFLERQAENPSMASRREMYDWISAEGLTIAPDGRIVGYKGLDHDGRSVRSGGAYVDGAWVDGQVPNPLGAVVSMDRPQVDDDRSRTCSFGLHVGSYAYAQSWSRGIVATVLVDPADVVSIPSDSGGQKMRTCRYEVVRVEKDSATYLGRVGTVAPDEFVDLDDDEGFEDDDFDEDDEPRIHDFTV
ncbi:hypothetical protein [Brevibacterium oceani]|uniref:hypothetical protein n=1 Tax=Brevibacterium oceani TaxID=358099 RepID=UPI0015E77C78|nr:hypothetical protein [Brevibacterium oceani]